MRITIERLRSLILAAGALLIVALIAFLALGRWKNRLLLKEIPHRLGANIQREANGFTYTQSHRGHTLFKIHASQVIQLKKDGRAQLHDVQIELYGQDGSTVDRISGGEFDYDQKAGIASAAGPVEITIMRPREAPAVAPGARDPISGKLPAPLANAANAAASGQIDVKTSGLTFDQKTGVATTAQRVAFTIVQGQGSSLGATFDSDKGQLVLDRDVELNVHRGPDTVVVRAAHGEFQRDELTCDLRDAEASYRSGHATAGNAEVHFRDDGSAIRLDARDGFSLTSATGAKIAGPVGTLAFNQKNQPTEGRLEGGITMESASGGRRVSGSAPSALLAFADGGELRRARLERGVRLHSEESGQGNARVVRDWSSPVADIDFRSAPHGQLQIASVKGTGGVVITGQEQRAGGAVVPSQMSADVILGEFGDQQELTRISGTGHATLDETTAAGVHQTTSGDRLLVQLAPAVHAAGAGEPETAQQIQSAVIEGNVVLTQQQASQAGKAAQPAMHATAGRAAYDGGSEWLHLTGNPRVETGPLQLTADKLDVSQSSGDAYARGNVKATWLESGAKGEAAPAGLTLGGQGPAHVVAAEAQLHRASNEATFRGQARLWQQANSVSAPVIVLDQAKQILLAHGSGAGQPVNVVFVSSGGIAPSSQPKPSKTAPSVIRVRAGDLKYSGAERKAILYAGAGGRVEADAPAVTTFSNEVEIVLLPPGNHAGPQGSSAQIDHLTARGDVVVSSNGRRGTGEQLVYSGENGNYVLTGTAAAPPRMSDPVRGSVTGEALIFNSRDDSVSIEGQGHKTLTQTIAPK